MEIVLETVESLEGNSYWYAVDPLADASSVSINWGKREGSV